MKIRVLGGLAEPATKEAKESVVGDIVQSVAIKVNVGVWVGGIVSGQIDFVGLVVILVNWKKDVAVAIMSFNCCLEGATQRVSSMNTRTEQRAVKGVSLFGVKVVSE